MNRSLVAWGVAAGILAAALVSVLVPTLSWAIGDAVIDTAQPVSPELCVPCHFDLGDINVPGLVFSHGNHLLVSCDGCHSRMPHREDSTERVPMDVCFACHGVEHGPQGELATGECADCHTKSFDLRPRSHVDDWAKVPHAEVGKASGVNRCMMCHDAPEDCDDCHRTEAPEVPVMPAPYHSLVPDRPAGPSVRIYPKGPVSMSQCAYCHADIDDVLPGRLIFAHAYHLQRNYRCQSCHAEFPHTALGIERPDMESCYRCHGMNHNSTGQVATEDCDACHPKQFELVPTSHTGRFIKGAHRDTANADPAYCAMCHVSAFCVGCHRGQKVSENAPGKAVVPDDHRRASWTTEHGPIYLGGKGACGSCHTDESCKRCHKTVMPHPTGWLADHKPAPDVPREDCGVCHQNRDQCQKCHHADVQRSQLIAKNCTPCHSEMRRRPPTAIKNKGFAEHAVHFDVAKKKGKPYTCADCHIGFSTGTGSANGVAGAMRGGLPSAGHDVRLCYGCHGNLDLRNQVIAPWPGAQLCLRCHTDLNI